MLDKSYRPAEVEAKLYDRWEADGAFAAHLGSEKTPYTIIMPPPNVTGSLHIGHALTFTIQDVLIRYYRMRGRDALWQPGTDHAGIATQMVVERNLAEEGKTRHDLGREGFVAKVWDWRAHSGGTILQQLRRLGASADWPRECFTMDEGPSGAVRKVFVDLHKQGLIYRAKRLVNWDPKLHTAISDLEVEQREIKGKLWYFNYPIEGEDGHFVTVATTRPETMLGDTGVAVHPDDPRYADLHGKFALQPITGYRCPIVADEYADPEQGSGAVKITPAHDFNDFEVGRRHNLAALNIFDSEARVIGPENAETTFRLGDSDDDESTPCIDWVPEAYRGLDRYEAREIIVAEMTARGLLEKIEEPIHVVPYGDRSGVPIEPWLTDQWFVDAKTLAGPCIEAVEQGRTVFVPKNWENTYFEWMRNIQPWCVSRQIWWGHQIPAWYGPDGHIFVEYSEQEAEAAAAAHYGKKVALERDPDVLDTWFSSALWPFSTLGWPEETPELARYYPGDVLVTGFDIIFFWVARMMMMGVHFMGDVPFHTVYIHALVRDAKGQKMSKSRGNIVDPLDIIDSFGSDALRFTLAALAVPGRDVKLAETRIEGYRNFATKLWQASRFCQMNGCLSNPAFDPASATQAVNRWVVSGIASLEERLRTAMEAYRFNDAANELYHFIWHSFCDWYIEFIKPDDRSGVIDDETRATAGWALDQLLIMLHPLMPFITEELWGELGPKRDGLLITTDWPDYAPDLVDGVAAAEIEAIVSIVSEIRAVRSEMNVPAKAKVPLTVQDPDPILSARLEGHRERIRRLGGLAQIEFDNKLPGDAVQIVKDGAVFALSLGDFIDVAAESARLRKEIEKLGGEIDKIDKKLGNKGFLAKAPTDVVATQRERREEAERTRNRLVEALGRLPNS
ncbi:MAG: valine--tRNA ligase [Alphaproteobacteria bacterium]|nr:valine--tRNA ligase [Alphaproteobacteria bacterium]